MSRASTILALAWQGFRQYYVCSDNRLLRRIQFCLIFTIGLLSFTIASVDRYLSDNLEQMLGADLVISQQYPMNTRNLSKLSVDSSALSVNRITKVTLTNKNRWQAVQLKIVDQHYPIQGQVALSSSLGGEIHYQQTGPEQNEIWLDQRAIQALGLKIGDSITIAEQSFNVSQVILHEPDRLLEGHSVAMRAMISESGSSPSFLKKDTSQYRYLMNARPKSLATLINWAERDLPGASVLHRRSGHPLATFWKRVENFLGLSTVLLFLMGAIAISLASANQIERQTRHVAICMSMGASRWQASTINIVQWLLNFVASLLPALASAYLAQYFVLTHLEAQFSGIQPSFNLTVLFNILLIMFLLLISLQIPNWTVLLRTSVSQLVQHKKPVKNTFLQVLWSTMSLLGLTLYFSDNWLLTSLTFMSLGATILLVLLLSGLVLLSGYYWSTKNTGLLSFCFYLLKQRVLVKSAQILGLSLCATILLFTLMLMKDIGQTMQKYTRVNDGNLMITQMQKQFTPQLTRWAEETGSKIMVAKPYLLSQLTHINDKAIDMFSPQPSETKAVLQKPVRVHWSEQIPQNNQLVKGLWWLESEENWQQISVEQEVMTDLGLTLGDRLRFALADENVEFSIVASHVFKPGFGSVTFWFQIPPRGVQALDTQHFVMGSLEVTPEGWDKVAALWQEIPGLRALSLKELTERFDRTLASITKLVVGFSVLITALSLLVIIAAVKANEQSDRVKNGLLLSFGLSKRAVVRLMLFEWSITAFIAGIGAIGGTWLAGTLIYQSQFNLVYTPDAFWSSITLLSIFVVVCFAGWLSSRHSSKTTVRALLQY